MLSYLERDKRYKRTSLEIKFLLHHSLLEVNVHQVVDNLSSLLYFQLSRFRTVGGAGGWGHVDWGSSWLTWGGGLGLQSREIEMGSSEI